MKWDKVKLISVWMIEGQETLYAGMRSLGHLGSGLEFHVSVII